MNLLKIWWRVTGLLLLLTGLFFGKDEQKSVLGNMVAAGKFLKYSRWKVGASLGIKAGNQLEMVTAENRR